MSLELFQRTSYSWASSLPPRCANFIEADSEISRELGAPLIKDELRMLLGAKPTVCVPRAPIACLCQDNIRLSRLSGKNKMI
jgi:hypothetical protein